MNITKVLIRKLSRPASAAPTATFIARLQITYSDGSRETSGAWFGTDRAELTARVAAWAAA